MSYPFSNEIPKDMINEVNHWRSKIFKKKVNDLDSKLELFHYEYVLHDQWYNPGEWMYFRKHNYWMPIYIENCLFNSLKAGIGKPIGKEW
jgi:hypothetical protein